MRVRLIGNSLAACYLANLAAEAGLEVEWHSSGIPQRLRPVMLWGTSVLRLRALFGRARVAMDFLLRAPEKRGLMKFGSEELYLYRDSSEEVRWIDPETLGRSLRALCAANGVKVVEKLPLPSPYANPAEDELCLLDIQSQEVKAWPPALLGRRGTHSIRLRRSLWLPEEGSESGKKPWARFAVLEDGQILLEPHPERGWVLSLFARNEAALHRLTVSLFERPRPELVSLRTLLLVNGRGARVETETIEAGTWHRHTPGVLQFGSSLGRFPAFGNAEVAEAFAQAERLARILPEWGELSAFNRLRAVEKHNESLKRDFRRKLFIAQKAEKWLFHPRLGRSTLKYSARVPQSVKLWLGLSL